MILTVERKSTYKSFNRDNVGPQVRKSGAPRLSAAFLSPQVSCAMTPGSLSISFLSIVPFFNRIPTVKTSQFQQSRGVNLSLFSLTRLDGRIGGQ